MLRIDIATLLLVYCFDASYGREDATFFSETSHSRSSIPRPTTDLRKTISAMIPGEQIPWLGYENKNSAKKDRNSDEFGYGTPSFRKRFRRKVLPLSQHAPLRYFSGKDLG